MSSNFKFTSRKPFNVHISFVSYKKIIILGEYFAKYMHYITNSIYSLPVSDVLFIVSLRTFVMKQVITVNLNIWISTTTIIFHKKFDLQVMCNFIFAYNYFIFANICIQFSFYLSVDY